MEAITERIDEQLDKQDPLDVSQDIQEAKEIRETIEELMVLWEFEFKFINHHHFYVT